MKTKKKIGDCALDSDALDDWLENDLRQSGILPRKDGKSNKYLKIEELADWEVRSFCEGSDDKTVVGDSDNSPRPSSSSSTQFCAPILKAFLATLQQRQRGTMILPISTFHQPSTSFSPSPFSPPSLTPESINPLHLSKTPGISSINTPKTSTSKTWISTAKVSTTSTGKKRHRALSNVPDSVNVMDPLDLKRLKNTDAARRSRQRKLMKLQGLQTRVAELEKLNEQLRSQVTMAENERDAGKAKEAKLRDKVITLEAQLAEAHESLLANVKQTTGS